METREKVAMSFNFSEPDGRIPFQKILVGTIAAIAAAIVVNVIVFFIADVAGAFPDDFRFEAPGGGETTMGMGNVVFSTISYLLVAGIVFAIVSRVSSRPVRTFLFVAAVALILSFITPFTIPDAPGGMVATLLIMHVLTAVVAVWDLLRVAIS